jgi:uncharacterized protein
MPNAPTLGQVSCGARNLDVSGVQQAFCLRASTAIASQGARLTPLHFGDSGSPLFGVLHAPVAELDRAHGVVVCPPIAQEHVRSHGALRQLAVALSRAGYHVLRFDWFGVGDSAGSLGEASLARFREDLAAAIEELVDRTGVRACSLFGARLGASVAISTPLSLRPARLVAWDPVLEGAAYLRAQRALHASLIADPNRFWQPSHGLRAPAEELVGFRFGATLTEELLALDLRAPREGLGTTHVLVSDGGALPPSWPSSSLAVTPRWETPATIEEKIFAAPLAQAVLAALGGPA